MTPDLTATLAAAFLILTLAVLFIGIGRLWEQSRRWRTADSIAAAAVLCAEPSCPERITATPATQCAACRGCFCDRHRRYGTFGPGTEPVTMCLDCIGPPDRLY